MLNLLLFSFFLWAQEAPNNCILSGNIVLSGPLQLFCMKDMRFAPGTQITTNGYELQITSVGDVFFGEGSRGVKIISYAQPGVVGHPGGLIYIYAKTARGNLSIANFGATANDLSGSVAIEYG